MKPTAFRAAMMLGALASMGGICAPEANAQTGFEGYGAVTTGGAGGDVYRVTTLADSGPGTLRDAITNRSGPRVVVFDVGGTITLKSDLVIRTPYLTVDGSTAPSPGITVKQSALGVGDFAIAGTHDIILTHLRFQGLYQKGGTVDNNTGVFGVDGDSKPDYHAQRIVLDHLTIRNSADSGPDFWGRISDVTISWCLIMNSFHPTTLSHYPAPYQTRQRISMHHNVYARNNDRNPQVRADTRDFDMVNNVIYGWGWVDGQGQGTRIRNEPGEPKVNANIVNNYWVPLSNPSWALVYGRDPGPDSTEGRPAGDTPAQGTVVANTAMGQLYVAGNMLPPENKDHYSTISAPLPVPPSAQVTTWSADQLKAVVLPSVGMQYRLPDEQAVIDELTGKMAGAPPVSLKGDFTGDGVVNQDDVIFIMNCVSGAGIPPHDPACANTDQDGDGDVDQSDFGLVQCCISDNINGLDDHCYN